MDWHKGKALLSLLGTLNLDEEDVLPLLHRGRCDRRGRFRALKGRGIGIVVWDQPYETAAAYSLKNPDEVREFLLRLIRFFAGGRHEFLEPGL
jgi:trehalose 6-phosphate phosphatase